MAPLRGWAPRGERLIAKVPHGHWNTTTSWRRCATTASMRHGSYQAHRWREPRPISGRSCPTLRPGDIVIMDNLGSHKGKAVRQLIRAAGAKLLSYRNTRPTSIRSSRSSPAQASTAKSRSANPRHRCQEIGQILGTLPQRSVPTLKEFRLCTNVKSSRSKLLVTCNILEKMAPLYLAFASPYRSACDEALLPSKVETTLRSWSGLNGLPSSIFSRNSCGSASRP